MNIYRVKRQENLKKLSKKSNYKSKKSQMINKKKSLKIYNILFLLIMKHKKLLINKFKK